MKSNFLAVRCGLLAASLLLGASVVGAAPEAQRNPLARVVTISQNGLATEPEALLKGALARLNQAASVKPDIVCLPETFTRGEPESISGPTVTRLSAWAREHECWVICPIKIRSGSQVLNSAVLLNRRGEVVGRYDKIRPTEYELENAIRPGPLDPPVFETDFGRIGIQICFDVNWRAQWEALKQKGAKIIFFPSAYPAARQLKSLAWQNQVFIVSATKNRAASIYDITGDVIDTSGHYRQWAQAELPVGKRLFETDFNVAKMRAIERKYGAKARIDWFHDDGLIALASLAPDLTVPDLIDEFGLIPHSAYIERSERAQDGRRKGSDATLIATSGSERATTGAGNKIVTIGGKTHVVWQKSAKRGYFNKIRSLDHATGKWSQEFSLNEGVDNHARPVIAVDSKGYLHAIMSGHNSTVTYRRSKRPNDASEWGAIEEAGEGTYPSIACGRNDTLYLAVRAKNQKGADFYARPMTGAWEKRARIVKRADQYSGYAGFSTGLTVDQQGTLHAICNVYEGKSGAHQALCYLRSRDQGISWETAAGKPVEVPARPEDMDLLLDDSTPRLKVVTWPWIVSRGNIVADSQGRPFIAYVSHIKKPGEVILASADRQGKWARRPVLAAERAFPKMRPIGVSVALSIAADDALYLMLEMTPLDYGWVQGKPLRTTVFREAPVKRLILLVSRDGGGTFDLRRIVEPGTMFNMANLERPTGYNVLPAGQIPPIIYFDGTCRYPKRGEVINNNVYFVPAAPIAAGSTGSDRSWVNRPQSPPP